MKVLIFNTLYWPNKVGGAEVSVGYLVEGFVSKGHEVVICCIGNEDNTYLDKNGAKVIQLKIKNLFFPFDNRKKSFVEKFFWHLIDNYNFLYKNEINDIIENFKPDVIHTNNLCGISVIVWDLAKKSKIKLIHTSRDYYLIHPSAKISNPKSLIQKISFMIWSYVKKNRSKNVNTYIGISKYILNEHIKNGFFVNSKKKVIYNSQVSNCKIELNNKKTGTKNLGFIGRISPEKGLDILLEAFNKANLNSTKLYIAGEGDSLYIKYLKNKYNIEDVIFLGKVKPEDYFELIDINIVPSVWDEPLGRVVIEAYSYGIPSIVSNSGGLPEIIQKGITGFIYEKYDINALSDLMINWKEEICVNYRLNCLKQMEKYSIDYISDSYLSAYSE